MKTLLVGNFGARNVGDELILFFALQKYKNAVVMTTDSEFSQAFCQMKFETMPPVPMGFRSAWKYLFSKKYRDPILVQRGSVDRVVFPGGGLFAIRVRAYFIWLMAYLWVKRLFPEAKVIFECQGVDKTEPGLQRKMVRDVFSEADSVSVRDKESAEFLKRLGVKNVELRGDLVAESLPAYKSTLPKSSEKNLILINARADFDPKFLDSLGAGERVFVAFDPSDARFVPSDWKGRIIFPMNVNEVFGLFSRARVVVGQRLHFLILGEAFCGAQNTFTLGKPYSQKVEAFVKERKIQEFGRK